MSYVLVNDSNAIVEYPYSIAKLKENNKKTSFPKGELSTEVLNSFNVYYVDETYPINVPVTQKTVMADTPVYSDNCWYITHVAVDRTDEEMENEKEGVRNGIDQRRYNKLSTSDWMANSDVTMTAEWATYRQALRDITAQAGYPLDITWPRPPGEVE